MTPDPNAAPPDQCASAAVVLGLVSLGTCWWFPFGALLGAAGTGLGLLGWWAGRTGERALVGTALAAFGAATGAALGWSYWQRVFGA